MSSININIINNGVTKGTVGYLAKHATSIKLGNTSPLYKGDQTRGAWLLDKDGNDITWLCSSNGETLRHHPNWEADWTDAARDALGGLIEIAQDLLDNQDSEADRVTFAVTAKS